MEMNWTKKNKSQVKIEREKSKLSVKKIDFFPKKKNQQDLYKSTHYLHFS